MRIEFSEIDYYVQHYEPKRNAWYQPYCAEDKISPTRQEVVLRLCKEICYYEDFPLWNHDLTAYLFPYHQKLSNKVTLMPVVGSGKYFDAKLLQHKNKVYLLVDLLNIADYTNSVLEMCYILHNICHVYMHRYLINQYYEKPETYNQQLEYRFFCEGIVQYLSWNQDVAKYRLKEARYIHRKKDAFYTLNNALEMRDPAVQEQILKMLENLDLWQRFPDVAGMFYCDRLYQKGGKQRLKEYIDKGFKGSIAVMLETEFAEIKKEISR